MDLTLLKEGLFVMTIGMGTVFIFLVIMIWVMYLNAYILKFVNKYFPEEVVQDKAKFSSSADEEIALAIACAAARARA